MRDDDEVDGESTDPREATTAIEGHVPQMRRALSGRAGERYRLGAEIGRGGMGEILGAMDEQIGREVAVKRMKERNPSSHAMGRFFREACIQGRLVISPTLTITATGVELESIILGISAPAKQALLVLYVVAVVAAAGGLAYANRRTERAIRDRLHLQAWQLRQLVS